MSSATAVDAYLIVTPNRGRSSRVNALDPVSGFSHEPLARLELAGT